MSLKKIFGYLVVLPQVILWLIPPLTRPLWRGVYLHDYEFIGVLLLIISLIGGLFLVYQNTISKRRDIGWYALAGLTIVVNIILIYLAYYFSPGF